MALEAAPAAVQLDSGGDAQFGNDAFSFWKPPEPWRERCEISVRASAVLAEWYLLERYLPERGRRPPSGMEAYYALKQAIPPWLRHRVNYLVIKARRRVSFPAWPWESALLELRLSWLRQIAAPGQELWHIGLWPQGLRCAVVLTHDVESLLGFERMERMAEVEERYGFRSAWNLPLAQYPLDWERIARLRQRGFEFGAHGLSHDGRLFRSYEDFRTLSARLHQSARAHDLRGFRSPSTLRRAEWIKLMDFDYDCSFADTDPYEPQPGGTCSLFPFFLGSLVELPYTLPQDHTLIHLLHRDPLPIWIAKARWIAQRGGMILSLIHPDYCGAAPYLKIYEELLKQLADLEHAWRALPSEVARWWRQRAQMQLTIDKGKAYISGEGAAAARVVTLREAADNGRNNGL